MKPKSIEGSRMMICTKSATMSWCEKQHAMCLQQQKEKEVRFNLLPPANPPNTDNLVHLSQNFQNLTKAMTDKTILVQRREMVKENLGNYHQ